MFIFRLFGRLEKKVDDLARDHHIGNMSDEILTMLGVGATLLASGGTFAVFLFRLFGRLENLFVRLEDKFVRLEDKVDDLARDHQSVARELSELRGEIRGRMGEMPAGGGAR